MQKPDRIQLTPLEAGMSSRILEKIDQLATTYPRMMVPGSRAEASLRLNYYFFSSGSGLVWEMAQEIQKLTGIKDANSLITLVTRIILASDHL